MTRWKLLRGPRAARAPEAPQGWPPGHFYSPIVAASEIERHRGRVFAAAGDRDLPGIALDLDAQLQTLERVGRVAATHPWREQPHADWRYGFENPNFGPGEALVLLGMVDQIRPRRWIEIGCGWSTRALLDAARLVLDAPPAITTVDPYASSLIPELVGSEAVRVIESDVQDVGLEPFRALEAGDVLFVDSSHVMKFGSDVNFVIGDVLPRLPAGVHVHFHDVRYPFEYPVQWVREGRNWNEAYALRAFLAFNSAFTIDLFAAYVWAVAPERSAALLPGAASSPGSSLWLRRV